MRARRNSRQHVQHSCIHLAGIRLPGHRIACLKSHLFCNHRVNPVNLLLVALKKFQKACLRARSPLRTEKLKAFLYIFKILKVHTEFLHPQRRTLPYSSGLRRLKVGECKGRKILVLPCKLCKGGNYIYKLFLYKLKSLGHQDHICIVPDITGRSAQMNDPLRFRALLSVGIYMRHDIVAYQLLPLLCHFIVYVVHVFFQFINLLLCDRKPQLLLCLRQCNPEFSPRTELFIRRKDILHFPACITL